MIDEENFLSTRMSIPSGTNEKLAQISINIKIARKTKLYEWFNVVAFTLIGTSEMLLCHCDLFITKLKNQMQPYPSTFTFNEQKSVPSRPTQQLTFS